MRWYVARNLSVRLVPIAIFPFSAHPIPCTSFLLALSFSFAVLMLYPLVPSALPTWSKELPTGTGQSDPVWQETKPPVRRQVGDDDARMFFGARRQTSHVHAARSFRRPLSTSGLDETGEQGNQLLDSSQQRYIPSDRSSVDLDTDGVETISTKIYTAARRGCRPATVGSRYWMPPL